MPVSLDCISLMYVVTPLVLFDSIPIVRALALPCLHQTSSLSNTLEGHGRKRRLTAGDRQPQLPR